MRLKKTKVCSFAVDNVFVFKSKQNEEMAHRTDVLELLMINYEGNVAVFNYKKRKRQIHLDPKLTEDICINSQNVILTHRNAVKTDLMILSSVTLKKLIVERIHN